MDESYLDEFFEKFSSNPAQYFPDGILDIDIKTLNEYNLLSEEKKSQRKIPIVHYLKIHDSQDRITLFNDHFAVWIVPEKDSFYTTVYIAKFQDGDLKIEIAFRAEGLHNKSKTILRLVERFLTDIQETDSMLNELEVQ
jgi:hypothetical protein